MSIRQLGLSAFHNLQVLWVAVCVWAAGLGGFTTGQALGQVELRSSAPVGASVAAPGQPDVPIVGNGPAAQVVSPAPAASEATPPAPALDALLQEAASRLELAQADAESAPEAKATLTQTYQQAQLDLKSAIEARQARQQWLSRLEAAPQDLAEARATEQKPVDNVALPESLETLSFAEVQLLQQQVQTQLRSVTDRRTKLADQIVARDKRRKELPQLTSDARTRVEQMATAAKSVSDSDDKISPQIKQATQFARQATKLLAEEQLKALEAEQSAYDAESELLPLQLSNLQASEKRLQEIEREVSAQLDRLRQDRILTLRNDVRSLTAKLSGGAKEFGKQLNDRIDQWYQLASSKTSVKQQLDESKVALDHWKSQLSKMEARVNGRDVVAGFNSWVGLILRKQRNELPSALALRSQILDYQDKVLAAESLLFDVEDQLPDAAAKLAAVGEVSADPQSELTKQLAAKTKEVVTAVRQDVNEYLDDLYEAADVNEQIVSLTNRYREFIDQHVLWIRSAEPMTATDFGTAMDASRWLVSYDNWLQVVWTLVTDLRTAPWWWGLFAIGWIVLMFNRGKLRQALVAFGESATKRANVDIRPTFKAAVVSVLIAMIIPVVIMFVAWRLAVASSAADHFARLLSQSLLVGVMAALPLQLLRYICRPHGLARQHFDWSEQSTQILKSNLTWLIPAVLGLAVIVSACEQYSSRWDASLGRICLMAMMLAISVFMARVFIPRSGVLSRFLMLNRNGWFDRLRYLWYGLLIVGPFLIAAFAWTGFNYSAQRIALHMLKSLWLLIGVTTVYFLLKRWLLLSRRALLISQARQRAAEVQRRNPDAGTPLPPIDADFDVVSINEQTQRLIMSLTIFCLFGGIYLIWDDVLPAIGLLDDFTVWTVQGDAADETIDITLKNLILVLPVIALVFIAARNVPGLMEIALLQHLPLTNAARYAITTLSRYAILIVGVIVVSGSIGLSWSRIQWLVAALGVGLGFGLQEIFANFVSGVVLLFEQPIRVGDIITLDGNMGTVTKIRMRATTVAQFDGQELVIPNKDLITGKLLNWTLSDSNNRIQLSVGVAYGTDIRQACQIAREACESHSNILKDPLPSVTFDAFGDNSLNLTLRAFLSGFEQRLQTLHELHTAVYEAFNAAGIEISFPQRDLHLRTLPPELDRWLVGQQASATKADDR